MATKIWSSVGDVGPVEIRDFGTMAEIGDYLVQGTAEEAGSGDTYGIGDDYLDEAETLLRRRGLTLEPDHQGLRVDRHRD